MGSQGSQEPCESLTARSAASPDWKTGMAVPRDIAVATYWEASTAIPSTPRCTWMLGARTQWVMLVHHVVTLVLIVSSYAFR